jgi:amino acid transporter
MRSITMASSPPEPDNTTTLSKGRLGVLGIVFFVVAAAAPLVGMTGAVPVAIVLGNGAAAPGAYLFVGITLLLFSVGYAAMSHRVTNAGAFFAYIGRGLGQHAGIASAFVSILAYVTIQLAIFGFFGAVVAGQFFRGGLGRSSRGSSSRCFPFCEWMSAPRFSESSCFSNSPRCS